MYNIKIEHEMDHYVGYIDEEFTCSGDTINEVRDTLFEILFPDIFNKEEES